MKDTTQRFYVRVYDSRFLERIEKLFERNKKLYTTLNPFLVDVLLRGVEVIEQEEENLKSLIQHGNIYNEMKRIVKILDHILDEGQEHYKESFVREKVNQAMLSRVYAMLLNNAKESEIPYTAYEKGLFDSLPKDFEEKIDLLNKEFEARGNT